MFDSLMYKMGFPCQTISYMQNSISGNDSISERINYAENLILKNEMFCIKKKNFKENDDHIDKWFWRSQRLVLFSFQDN